MDALKPIWTSPCKRGWVSTRTWRGTPVFIATLAEDAAKGAVIKLHTRWGSLKAARGAVESILARIDGQAEAAKPTRQELETMVSRLAGVVIWALEHLEAPGSVGLTYNRDTHQVKAWQELFFDALDLTGNVVDRKAYYAQKKTKKRRRKS